MTAAPKGGEARNTTHFYNPDGSENRHFDFHRQQHREDNARACGILGFIVCASGFLALQGIVGPVGSMPFAIIVLLAINFNFYRVMHLPFRRPRRINTQGPQR